ncbi:MAG: acetyl-CoA carboxylase biotin carboxylase subunit [Ignavibacteriales bacterium]|nr:acetyl-CoA carboxylase biotin carboxylase subunit [Ignavibacteriales bacterium]
MTNKRPIQRLLIANRGEIALRVIRACKELDITSVSVFSDIDRKSLHVLLADEAYPLGGSTPREGYLHQSRIIEVARNSGVDAIHPGYGFLAENPDFADAVRSAGLIFIGPSGAAIRMLGDKTSARKMARRLGIPTISGTVEPILDVSEASRLAQTLGFPILLKAAAGGGGKGMRVVRSDSEFESAFRMAQSEAKGAFGDDRVYMEKYLDGPRHIEMQILADEHGNVVYLGERECSIQRRHQKVIEESPSTVVTDELRTQLGSAAVGLAKAAGYSNAGTMEFLLDSEGHFYFLEMNTRLQVEHPVTEEITGIDLVIQQIRIAEGEPLSVRQDEIRRVGHSIECRICAEDPAENFMPSTGKLTRYRLPEGRIRVENGFRQGDEVSVFYDSLMAKVVSWGETRDDAIRSMRRALSDFSIGGVKTTIPFCLHVLKSKAFLEGKADTSFVEKHFDPSDLMRSAKDQRRAAAIAAVLILQREKSHRSGLTVVIGESNRWKASRGEAHR